MALSGVMCNFAPLHSNSMTLVTITNTFSQRWCYQIGCWQPDKGTDNNCLKNNDWLRWNWITIVCRIMTDYDETGSVRIAQSERNASGSAAQQPPNPAASNECDVQTGKNRNISAHSTGSMHISSHSYSNCNNPFQFRRSWTWMNRVRSIGFVLAHSIFQDDVNESHFQRNRSSSQLLGSIHPVQVFRSESFHLAHWISLVSLRWINLAESIELLSAISIASTWLIQFYISMRSLFELQWRRPSPSCRSKSMNRASSSGSADVSLHSILPQYCRWHGSPIQFPSTCIVECGSGRGGNHYCQLWMNPMKLKRADWLRSMIIALIRAPASFLIGQCLPFLIQMEILYAERVRQSRTSVINAFVCLCVCVCVCVCCIEDIWLFLESMKSLISIREPRASAS